MKPQVLLALVFFAFLVFLAIQTACDRLMAMGEVADPEEEPEAPVAPVAPVRSRRSIVAVLADDRVLGLESDEEAMEL